MTAAYFSGGILDGALALGVVLAVWSWQRKRVPARVAWWLFALVLVKCLVPLPVEVSLPLPQSEPAGISGVAEIQEPALVISSESGASVAGAKFDPLLWIAGACLAGGFSAFVFQWRRTVLTVRRAEIVEEGIPLARSCGVKRSVRLALSTTLRSPVVWGWRRPVIILPAGLRERLTESQMNWLLAHECGHLKRGDVITGCLVRLVRCVFFFNPVVHVAGRMMERFAEQDCDRLAGEALGMPPKESAESFLAIVERSAADGLLAPGLSPDGKKVKGRLVELLRGASRRPLTVGGFGVLLVSLLVIVPSFRGKSADRESIESLQSRVAELEERLRGKSEGEQRRERNQARARARAAEDVARIGAAKVHAAERLYQSAKKHLETDEISEAMRPLFEQYPETNRAGCGALFLARLLPAGDPERRALLQRCMVEWSNCYFLDGTSVGGMARYLLFKESGEERRMAELRENFPDAIHFSGALLTELASR